MNGSAEKSAAEKALLKKWLKNTSKSSFLI